MDPSTRRRALRQAAKIAMGAAFVGCASNVGPQGQPDVASDMAPGPVDGSQQTLDAMDTIDAIEVASIDSTSVDTSTDAALACNLTQSGDGGLTQGALSCCFALTDLATPEAGTPQSLAMSWASDPSLSGCCNGIYVTSGGNMAGYAYGGNPPPWQVEPCMTCAIVVGVPSACTPWGPPVPPAMPEALQAACVMDTLDLPRSGTSKAMPAMPAFHGELREAAIATWRARMKNEYGSAGTFEALSVQLEAAGFGGSLAAECRVFADEERQHGVLCGSVVEALGGEARVQVSEPATFPEHADTSRRAAALRNVVSICCMSETVAVALIGAERIEMEASDSSGGPQSLTALLTRIHADEIGHARFGWRLLERVSGSLTAAERNALNAYIPVALAHLHEHEMAHLPDHGGLAHGAPLGLCSGRDARVLFLDTVREVIIPGLARLLGNRRPRRPLTRDRIHRSTLGAP